MKFSFRLISRIAGKRFSGRKALPESSTPPSQSVTGSAEELFQLGNELRAQKRHEQALACYDQVLALQPDMADAWCKRGHALQDLRRYDEAVASYDKTLAIHPRHAAAWSAKGGALQELRRHREALESCDKALAIQPDLVFALCNQGNALQALKRHQEALASYDKALDIRPDNAYCLYCRGNALQALHRHDAALADYDKALAIDAAFMQVLVNRGNSLKVLNRHEEALISYGKALAVKPDFAKAHFNESTCRLLLGDFERGWDKYEWRHAVADFTRHKSPSSLWLGKDSLAGKTILLHSEQGLGDTIQFARYAQDVAGQGARVILEVQPALKSLLSDMDGAHQVFGQGEALPAFDFHCPLMSLPLAFNTSLNTIPTPTPYLKASAKALDKWKDKLGNRLVPRVGIVWSGNPDHPDDHNRSMAVGKMLRLSDAGVQLVSLQNEVRPDDEEVLATAQVLHFGSELQDFSDTAALASLMDLVIAVDTSIVHLAGALGKPVWILLPLVPDWRWLLGRKDSPWYSTARLFRQKARGDWDEVMGRVQRQLHQFIGEHRRSP